MQQGQGQGIGGVVRVQAVEAEGEGAGHVLFVARGRNAAALQGGVIEYVHPAQVVPIGRGGDAVAVAVQIAARQMQGQGQVAQLGGQGVEVRVVVGQVGPEFAQEGHTFGPGQHAQGECLHPQHRVPGRAAAGHQHPAAACAGSPAVQQCFFLAVVKDQQPGGGLLPAALHKRRLFGQGQIGEIAAGRHLRQHSRGVGQTEPVDAAGKEAPVAMDKLHGGLALADAAQPGGRRDLADCRRAAGAQGPGQGQQFRLPSGEEGIAAIGHTRAGGQGCVGRQAVGGEIARRNAFFHAQRTEQARPFPRTPGRVGEVHRCQAGQTIGQVGRGLQEQGNHPPICAVHI